MRTTSHLVASAGPKQSQHADLNLDKSSTALRCIHTGYHIAEMTSDKKLLPLIPSYAGHKKLAVLAWLIAIVLWPLTIALVLGRLATSITKPAIRYLIFGLIAFLTLFNGVLWVAIYSVSTNTTLQTPNTSESATTLTGQEPTSTARAATATSPSPPTSKSASTSSTGAASKSYNCDASLWNHIYHAYRLHIIQRCVTVSGTIDHLIHEADGDIHVRLHLDAAYSKMLDSKNISEQHGDLVLEAVCEESPTQSDALRACANYRSVVDIPPVGTHVTATGSYVFDADHGWNEIHPITSIVPTR